MIKLTHVLAATALITTAGLAQARDLSADESQQLVTAGTIQSVEKLNDVVFAQHPGASIHETELEEENSGYVYQVDIRDAQGLEWDLELDAATGKVLKNEQDD